MRARTIAGTILALAGVGAYAAGTMILINAFDGRRVTRERERLVELACRDQLVKLAAVAQGSRDGNRLVPLDQSGTVEIQWAEVRDPRRALADATAALAMCPNRAISEICIGVACGPSAGPLRMSIKMTLGTK